MKSKMKNISAIFLITCCALVRYKHRKNTLYAAAEKPKLISKIFAFTEGPAVDKKGNIFFTDQPNNKIWEYTTDGQLFMYMENAGRPNGTYVDKKGISLFVPMSTTSFG
jgi:gluconolactonase